MNLRPIVLVAIIVTAIAIAAGFTRTEATVRDEALRTAVTQLSDKELECLAKNVYFEAGNQSKAGQVAVALVTLNRTNHPMFPSTVCKVVAQGSMDGRPTGRNCQFSWFCSGRSKEPKRDSQTWATAVEIAKDAYIMFHKGFDITNGATHFHATYVNPSWAKHLVKVARIDDHIFYRRAHT